MDFISKSEFCPCCKSAMAFHGATTKSQDGVAIKMQRCTGECSAGFTEMIGCDPYWVSFTDKLVDRWFHVQIDGKEYRVIADYFRERTLILTKVGKYYDVVHLRYKILDFNLADKEALESTVKMLIIFS